MFKPSANSPIDSRILSEVLDEIGVNDRIVSERRRVSLLMESLFNIAYESWDGTTVSMYLLGSQSEGTTTLGLHSDLDILDCFLDYNVMQNMSEWKQGMTNLLMIQDETTTPGYCFLQLLRDDEAQLMTYCPNNEYISDIRGRVLMKHKSFDAVLFGGVQHGPSCFVPGGDGYIDKDHVPAYPCKSWPRSAAGWIERQGIGGWPTLEEKRHIVRNGCFVVPVGSKVSVDSALEWRISTCLAERCLMNSLNITQIRCYILMKMVVKTVLNPEGENNLSSFMCKTVLFHRIENTESSTWKENNLLTCFTNCLNELYNCIQNDSCSHFIISKNNLMAGQFQAEEKQHIMIKLSDFIQSDGLALFQIQTDNLGKRLHQSFNERFSPADIILRELYLNFVRSIFKSHATSLQDLIGSTERMKKNINRMSQISKNNSRKEKAVCSLLLPLFCTTLGTSLASSNIEQNQNVSHEALEMLSAGLKYDGLSSKLKLASVFYSAGYMEITECILRDTEMFFQSNTVLQLCSCRYHLYYTLPLEFIRNLVQQNEVSLANKCTCCVKFLKDELNCVPRELQYEMFRSTQEELRNRSQKEFYWMDWAVVDPLPYLYFLQYKTYSQLQRYQDLQEAVNNLSKTIETGRALWHSETALNLLGQCLEQLNQPQDALQFYMLSLQERANNNAAGILICCLLAKCASHI